MEQHPVPQQISSYQFRLVGDMTLKQFFQLAGGALLALLVYTSPLPGIFKWPLVGFFTIAGAALAFLPIEERPLEVWIIAFFRSVYSPTQFYWSKPPQPVSYFVAQTPAAVAPAPTNVPQTTLPSAEVNKAGFLSRLEDGEKNFMNKMSSMFSGGHVVAQPTAQNTQSTPEPVESNNSKIAEPMPIYTKPTVTEQEKPTPNGINISESAAAVAPVAQTLSAQQTATTQAAQFSPEAAPPHPPTQANIIVGQVMDASGKIVEGAILEVRDLQSRPVRALRSNRAGHFLIVTPLANGKYELIVEKEGYHFEKLIFEANGSIIPPMAIKGNVIDVSQPIVQQQTPYGATNI